MKQKIFIVLLSLITLVPMLRAQQADSIEIEGVIYTYNGSSYSATGLTAAAASSKSVNVYITISTPSGTANITNISFKSSTIQEINCIGGYRSIVDAFNSLPSLKAYNIIDGGTGYYYYSQDGVVYSKSQSGTALEFYPPSKEDAYLEISSDIYSARLAGNRYLKSITFPASLKNIYMSQDFPELVSINVKGDGDRLKIVDGALYYFTGWLDGIVGGKEKWKFIHLPIKSGVESFTIWEKTTEMNYWPNVKSIYVDSEDVVFRVSTTYETFDTIGDDVEEIVFLKPTSSNVRKMGHISFNDIIKVGKGNTFKSPYTGKKLRRFVLPSNFYVSPFDFLDFTITDVKVTGTITNQNTIYSIVVTKNPALKIIGGRYLAGSPQGYVYGTPDPRIGIKEEINLDSNHRQRITLSTGDGTINDGWIYPDGLDIVLDTPIDYDAMQLKRPTDLNSAPFDVYYTQPVEYDNLSNVVGNVAGLILNMPTNTTPCLAYPRLKELTLIFPDKFSGLGTSHFGGYFYQKNSYLPQVIQYSEDGTTRTLCRPENLRKVGILGNIEYIPYGYFSNFISIEELTLPESLVSIGDKALYGCSKLLDVHVNASLPPMTYNDTFTGMRQYLANLYVPAKSENLYSRALGWKEFYIHGSNTDAISVVKSIENAGEVQTDFSGVYGEYAHLSVVPNDGYVFMGWFDENNRNIGSSNDIDILILRPTVVKAVFMPEFASSDISVTIGENNSVILSFPGVAGADSYRISIFVGTMLSNPLMTFNYDVNGSVLTKANTLQSFGNLEIPISAPSNPGLYTCLIESLDSNGNCSDAKMITFEFDMSGVSSIFENKPVFSVIGNTLVYDNSDVVSTISVWSIQGSLIYQNTSSSGSVKLDHGVYIVVIAGRSYKIII